MLSKILTVVLLVSVGACEKEYKKAENENVSVVSYLNAGKFETVIEIITRKKERAPHVELTPRDRYYLSSAYALKAGVDVYSLYSVMEIQLFHKKALDWSDLSKDKNPYLKFMKNQDGGDSEAKKLKKEQMWEKFLPGLKVSFNIKDHKKTLEELRSDETCHCTDLSAQEYAKMDAFLKLKADALIDSKMSMKEYYQTDVWYAAAFDNDEHKEFNYYNAYSSLSSYYGDVVLLALKKNEFLNPIKANSLLGGEGWEMVFMNILWNTYESIPIMKKLPELSGAQQESLTLALETNLPLLKDKEFRDVSLKNLMILSSVSLLSVYTRSFDLNSVTSMKDLYCYFDPNVILNNYGLIRKRILFIQKVYEELDVKDKDYEKYKTQIDGLEKHLVEELSEDQKFRYAESVKKFQVDSCMNG